MNPNWDERDLAESRRAKPTTLRSIIFGALFASAVITLLAHATGFWRWV